MDIELKIRRYAPFWRGVTPEAVGAYLKTLRQERKRFDKSEFALPRPFRLNDEVREILNDHAEEMRRTNVEYREMFKMIKKKLARERKIIL